MEWDTELADSHAIPVWLSRLALTNAYKKKDVLFLPPPLFWYAISYFLFSALKGVEPESRNAGASSRFHMSMTYSVLFFLDTAVLCSVELPRLSLTSLAL